MPSRYAMSPTNEELLKVCITDRFFRMCSGMGWNSFSMLRLIPTMPMVPMTTSGIVI
jgi:hypothetical protein